MCIRWVGHNNFTTVDNTTFNNLTTLQELFVIKAVNKLTLTCRHSHISHVPSLTVQSGAFASLPANCSVYVIPVLCVFADMCMKYQMTGS